METKTAPKRKTIRIARVFNHPISKVWQAWSDPEELKKWWGPRGYTCPFSSINFRVGGQYLNCMRSEDGKEFWSTGVFKDIVPKRKIVLTDCFSNDKGQVLNASELGMPGDWPKELHITVEFEDKGRQTGFRLNHEGMPFEIYEDCIRGWNESFDKLDELI